MFFSSFNNTVQAVSDTVGKLTKLPSDALKEIDLEMNGIEILIESRTGYIRYGSVPRLNPLYEAESMAKVCGAEDDQQAQQFLRKTYTTIHKMFFPNFWERMTAKQSFKKEVYYDHYVTNDSQESVVIVVSAWQVMVAKITQNLYTNIKKQPKKKSYNVTTNKKHTFKTNLSIWFVIARRVYACLCVCVFKECKVTLICFNVKMLFDLQLVFLN